MSISHANSLFGEIDLSLLRHFFAIASYGGFSRASRATGVSQPALSLGLQKLEKTLGARLIQRSAGQFSLTSQGQTLLTFCQRLEGGLESLVTSLGGAAKPSRRRRLRIGTALSIGFQPLADFAERNSSARDPYELELLEQNTYHLLDQVAEGTLEAALVPNDVQDPRLRFAPLLDDRLVFVSATRIKKLSREAASRMTLVNYARETPMRATVDQLCLKHKLEFRSTLSTNTLDSIKMLIRGPGFGAFILRRLVNPEIESRELFEAELPFPSPRSGIRLATRDDEAGEAWARTLKSGIAIGHAKR